MTQAIIHEVGNDGEQHEVCRLTLRGEEIILSDDNATGRFILQRPVMDYVGGRELTAEDGGVFLAALPAAYSGSRLRVELVP